MNYYELKVN